MSPIDIPIPKQCNELFVHMVGLEYGTTITVLTRYPLRLRAVKQFRIFILYFSVFAYCE
jgi:hypothetical protein